MTSGERLFFFILAFRFLSANPVSLDFFLTPKINCYDLNNNGISDFIAVDNSELPRTLYHIEISSSGADILFEYTMPEDKKGYFADMILGDFDYDGTIELIAAAYQDESSEIFFIFSADAMGFYSDSPIITKINNTRTIINNPRKLYKMEADANLRSMFLLSQGSPNRRVIICEYLDGEIKMLGSVGEDFLINSLAPIEIALGDFNGDSIIDVNDVILLLYMILDLELETSGDLNNDGNVDILDIIELINIILN